MSECARNRTTQRQFQLFRPTLLLLLSLVSACSSTHTTNPSTPRRGISLERYSARRVALILGNQAYAQTPLQNTRRDAAGVAITLRQLGFDVRQETDLTRRAMRIAIDDYVGKMHRGDISFFFYSGHGIQVRGENYLVPVDFAAQSEADVEDDGFRVGHILEKLEETAPSVNIVVLDACRNNPFLPNKGLVRGLAGISTSGTGSLIAFATSPGKVADDGVFWFSANPPRKLIKSGEASSSTSPLS